MNNTPSVSVIAERIHVCTACGDGIEIGDRYIRWLVPSERWRVEKRHIDCVDDMRHLTDETPSNPNE